MEYLKDFYKEIRDEADQYEDIGYKSIKVRQFVKDLSKLVGEPKILENAAFNAFVTEFPSIEISTNYFHTICIRGFKCASDSRDNNWIDVRYPREIRARKKKWAYKK